jgi:hypothetical protein
MIIQLNKCSANDALEESLTPGFAIKSNKNARLLKL